MPEKIKKIAFPTILAAFLTLFFSLNSSASTTCQDSNAADLIQKALSKETASVNTSGNALAFLTDAEQDYEARLDLLKNAKKFITFYSLCFSPITRSESTKEHFAIFLERALDGVEVRMIYHPIAQMGWGSLAEISALANAPVRGKMQIRGYWYKNVGALDFYKFLLYGPHKKICLVDNDTYGIASVVGGRNIGDEYLKNIPDPQDNPFPNQWRDFDIFMWGKSNHELQKGYIRAWNDLTGKVCNPWDTPQMKNSKMYFPEPVMTHIPESITYSNITTPVFKNTQIRVLENEPDYNKGKGIFEVNAAYHAIFKNAKCNVLAETPYFVPPTQLMPDIQDALKRGVKFRFLTNSKNTNDMGFLLNYCSGYYWDDLINRGAEIYLWDVPRSKVDPSLWRTMHAKLVTVDDAMFMPGSWNIDNRSYSQMNELSYLINDPNVTKEANTMMDNDLKIQGVFQINKAWIKANYGTAKDKLLMRVMAMFTPFL